MNVLETLSIIGDRFNKLKFTWGVGGSLLLNFYQLIDKPNDIDILVSETNAIQLNEVISFIGISKQAKRSTPFLTTYFTKYSIQNIDIDIMGGFAIQHTEGVYKLSLKSESIVAHKKINGVDIPLCSLEDWYILYCLIPGKQEKADLIENHLKSKGITHPRLLEEALLQPLPFDVKERVVNLLMLKRRNN
ncbi:hypothetical protein ACFSCX_11565 [Bacillus salitolerans]|uniref:Nucleotidyl transferase AbiEii/AbiGii toxin family protein n=1 Tax=Bacillus salitolerans TaxID=1437434 RepID=A0ABW4LPS9_9BACI